MKKLLTAVAVATLTTSSYANEGKFYLRADGGLSYLPKQTLKWSSNNPDELENLKVSTKYLAGSFGVGYYLTDNIRSELVLSHYVPGAHTTTITTTTNVSFIEHKLVDKYKFTSTITSVMAKGLFDAYDFGAGKLFVGAGAGISLVSAKLHNTWNEEVKINVLGTNVIASNSGENTYKWKKKNNFAYLVTAGASFNVTDTVKLDVAYTYADHGKLKKIAGKNLTCKYKLATHNVTAGVRISL